MLGRDARVQMGAMAVAVDELKYIYIGMGDDNRERLMVVRSR